MTAEAASAAAQPGPAKLPTAMTYSSKQHRHREHINPGPRAPAQEADDPVRADPLVTTLVMRARKGDKQAWEALVERYATLIWSICRRQRLGDADAEGLGQRVWLQLAGQLNRIRDPAALPGWLATTTRQECLRVLRPAPTPLADGQLLDVETIPDEHASTAAYPCRGERRRHLVLAEPVRFGHAAWKPSSRLRIGDYSALAESDQRTDPRHARGIGESAGTRIVHRPYVVEQDEDGVWSASPQLRPGSGL